MIRISRNLRRRYGFERFRFTRVTMVHLGRFTLVIR